MQVKNHFYKLLPSLIIILALTSCRKDFLNPEEQDGVLLREQYVVDLKTTNEYLKGTYAALSINVFESYHSIYPDLIADNVKPRLAASGSTPMINQYNWTQFANNLQASLRNALNCNSMSYACYRVVNYANFVIEASDKYRTENADLADQLKGQGLALRAYCNFMLLNFFAQPYNYTPDASHPGIALFVTWDPLKEKTARSSVKDSYVSVINDLLSATALLGEAPFVKSAFTKWSAMAMLSRVYLYSGDYAKAKDYAVSVINEIPLMITGYPEKLFTAENTESIFELPPATNASLYGTSYASDLYRSDRFHATGDIADVLNEDLNDSRSAWISEQSGNWSVVKFPEDVVPDATSPQSAYFQPVLRSSELYLTASEAYQELDKTDSAIFYLDAIRMRANPLALPTISSGNGLKEGIRNERRKELAFEGHRMFDLQRWNQKVVRADVLQGSPSELPYPNDKAIAPISTLDVEGFGISQNAGY